MTCHSSSLNPSHVPDHGLKLQSASVYKNTPEAPQFPGVDWAISPIADREVGAEVLQENLVTVLPWCSSGEAHLVYLPPLYLQVPVDEPVGFKVVVVLPKRVDELLSHLHVESTQQRSPLPLSLQGEKSGVMSLSPGFPPKRGWVKSGGIPGLGDTGICNFPLFTQASCNSRSSFFPSSKGQSLEKVQLVSRMRQLEN